MFIQFGIKFIKSFIDNKFRAKVVPVKGSVVYADLYGGVEHSGIYIGNNEISNIVVKGFTESVVEKSSPSEFTDKSILHKNIYVSCDSNGAVGSQSVSDGGIEHLGEKAFYGLVFKNCHAFSEKCVNYSRKNYILENLFQLSDIDETWERTIKSLKSKSKQKIGATKWRLWDLEKTIKREEEEPNLEEIEKKFKNMLLTKESIETIRNELDFCNEYLSEISDEKLPKNATDILVKFKKITQDIDSKYKEVEKFIKLIGCDYSYNELMSMEENFLNLAKEMEGNSKIKEFVRRLGKEYISEEKKMQSKIIKRMNNEILGIHKSNDLMRILPSELSNFESEELEYLFYSKFLENSLLTYEIVSKDYENNLKSIEELTKIKNKGPVIACLDTSGSMMGIPDLKAKALLLSISKILEKENRCLYIILFGITDEIKELNLEKKEDIKKMISFLNNGFGGGTDFEAPLKRGVEIIGEYNNYNKADIVMITDGYCELSDEFIKKLKTNKRNLGFSIYTIICGNDIIKDSYSDEIIWI